MDVNSGDVAWVLASTALVLLMTPGLAFFYGGMTKAKSTLNMMLMSFATICVVSILWVIFGFSLAFGNSGSGFYGAFSLSGLSDAVNAVTNNGGVYGIPLLLFAGFQLMFAVITPALISGAIADRTKFLTWVIFVAIWVTIVYFPVAHWVFDFGDKADNGAITGAGWLANLGVEDFAGGTAVHINAGAAGLALAIVLGRRLGFKKNPMNRHPTMPPTRWTPTTSSESSKLNLYFRPTAKAQMMPARRPRTTAAQGAMNAHAGVTATRPATAPEAAPRVVA